MKVNLRNNLIGTCLLAAIMMAPSPVQPAFGAQASTVLTTFHSFDGTNDGASPYAGLVQGCDGNFYGTTQFGGTNNSGTVFKISSNGALTTFYSFTGWTKGAADWVYPNRLVQGSDGFFYGTTSSGGTDNYGTVFKISSDGALTTLYSFTGGNDGAIPQAALVHGSDGYFYGTTQSGGTNVNVSQYNYGYGTVFKISTAGTLTSLYSFTGGNDGSGPQAGLVQGRDGYFYGTTYGGGTNDAGTVFQISTEGELKSLYSFTFGIDGSHPSQLVQNIDGNLFGTTYGGYYDPGTVFKISTNGTLTSLYSFTGGTDGANPAGGLVKCSDGSFYGTTAYGGQNGYGSVFKITANGVLTNLYSFGSVLNTNGFVLDGANPISGLVQDIDGSFYGTTVGGGQWNGGTVFRLTIVPEFQTMSLINGKLAITWSTEPGGTYLLQYNYDLSSRNWINLTNAFTATGVSFTLTDSVTNSPQRFYRVMLSR